jgi:(2Fe-2S) ferredoxin
MPDERSKPLRKRRLVLCMGTDCNSGGQAESLYNKLVELLGERGPAWISKGPVRWEIATCLNMCGLGPNLVVYPEGTPYHNLDPETLEGIVRKSLQEANPEGNL